MFVLARTFLQTINPSGPRKERICNVKILLSELVFEGRGKTDLGTS